MNDLTERLTRCLEAEAATVHAPEDAWERFSAGNMTPAPLARPRRLWLAAPVGVVAAAAALLIVVFAPQHHPVTSVAAPPPVVTVPATLPAHVVTAPVGGPVPAGFTPSSVTFASATEGWVLGTAPCASPPCTSIVRTLDAGHSWKGIPAPRVPLDGVTSLRFADPLDGWAFGASLWATHDGGSTWDAVSFLDFGPVSQVFDVEASGGYVHAAFFDNNDSQVRIATSPVGSDSWQVSPLTLSVGAGPVPSVQIVLHGASGWLVVVNRTVIDGAELTGGQWTAWTPPCASALGPAVVSATNATELGAACGVGEWGGTPEGEQYYASGDGGRSFTLRGNIPLQSVDGLACDGAAGDIAAGATASGLVLDRTVDGGQTWRAVTVLPATGSWVDVGFTTLLQGVAVSTGPNGDQLLMTRDAGATWAAVTF